MESRGESQEAQQAVAAITSNRVTNEEHSNTICKVVYKKKQFSWTSSKTKINDKVAFYNALRIAKNYHNSNTFKRLHNRKFFNEARMGKRFKTKYKPITIGKLIFY